jgi:hypothetical protein
MEGRDSGGAMAALTHYPCSGNDAGTAERHRTGHHPVARGNPSSGAGRAAAEPARRGIARQGPDPRRGRTRAHPLGAADTNWVMAARTLSLRLGVKPTPDSSTRRSSAFVCGRSDRMLTAVEHFRHRPTAHRFITVTADPRRAWHHLTPQALFDAVPERLRVGTRTGLESNQRCRHGTNRAQIHVRGRSIRDVVRPDRWQPTLATQPTSASSWSCWNEALERD